MCAWRRAALNDARASKPGRRLVMRELASMHDRRAFLTPPPPPHIRKERRSVVGDDFHYANSFSDGARTGSVRKTHGETHARKRKA